MCVCERERWPIAVNLNEIEFLIQINTKTFNFQLMIPLEGLHKNLPILIKKLFSPGASWHRITIYLLTNQELDLSILTLCFLCLWKLLFQLNDFTRGQKCCFLKSKWLPCRLFKFMFGLFQCETLLQLRNSDYEVIRHIPHLIFILSSLKCWIFSCPA